MDIAAALRKSLDESWCLRLHTDHPDGTWYDGVVTAVQPEIVVLREVVSFAFDGTIVLPRRVIVGVRDGEFEHTKNRVLRHAGALRRGRSPVWLEGCASVREVLHELQQRDIWPGVEVVWVGDDGRDAAYYIGPILEVDDEGFRLHGTDAKGAWDDVLDLLHDEVSHVTIDDGYLRRFGAWMRAEGPERPL